MPGGWPGGKEDRREETYVRHTVFVHTLLGRRWKDCQRVNFARFCINLGVHGSDVRMDAADQVLLNWLLAQDIVPIEGSAS